MNTIEAPVARLFYETLGSAPLILMIPGANDISVILSRVAGDLAVQSTVLAMELNAGLALLLRPGELAGGLLPRIEEPSAVRQFP